MSFVDVIIIIFLMALIGVLIYFSFIKNRGNPCYNCPYSKSCDKGKCSINKIANKEE